MNHDREALFSARPEIRSEPAERLGREGIVTVWDEHGRYVGCMGVELWKHMLTAESGREPGSLLGARWLTAAILVYAARYALGRRTSAPHEVEEAIQANLDLFRRDHGCREALIRDIEAARDHVDDGALGDSMDRAAWMRTLGRLESCRA